MSFDLVDFYHYESHLVGGDSMKLTGREIARLMDALRLGFEQKNLTAPKVETHPFEHAVEAYEAVGRGGARVKHVLVPR